MGYAIAMPDDQSRSVETDENTTHQPAWAGMHLWQMQPVRDVLLGLSVFALIIIGQKTSVVTVPLLLAILLAYLFEPVIVWIMKKFGASRRVSVIAIMVAIIVGVVLPIMAGGAYAAGQLVSFTTDTISNVNRVSRAIDATDQTTAREKLIGEYVPADPSETAPNAIPDAWVWVYDEIQAAQTNHNSSFGDALDAGIDWITSNSEQVAKTTASVSVDLVNRGLGIIGAAFGISFMVFVTAFFFSFTATEWIQLKGFGVKLLPDKNRERIIDLLQKFDAVISGFIRGRITIAFIQGIVFSIGYFIIGVPGAFILGPVVAVLSIVPYLALIGLPISVSLLGLQGHEGFRGEWWWILGAPAAIYFLGQALDDYVWTPLIQGKSTGMDTPTILFASLAGGALFGVFGLLIAIPIAACVKILIQEIFWPRFKEWAEGRADDPLPIE